MEVWVWCPVCERCYSSYQRRWHQGKRVCQYANCSCSYQRTWSWYRVRLLVPQYPEIPQVNVRYSRVPARRGAGA